MCLIPDGSRRTNGRASLPGLRDRCLPRLAKINEYSFAQDESSVYLCKQYGTKGVSPLVNACRRTQPDLFIARNATVCYNVMTGTSARSSGSANRFDLSTIRLSPTPDSEKLRKEKSHKTGHCIQGGSIRSDLCNRRRGQGSVRLHRISLYFSPYAWQVSQPVASQFGSPARSPCPLDLPIAGSGARRGHL
ncbi:MAG: hypothetical protein JWL77_260 [Chthonomonadaceae bacterium]|nr:hypothetical protein [Chthonomonadaceae bacterium]